jgi:hypothetical protein
MSRRKTTLPQFVPHTIEMLESAAYRALSVSGHRVLARIEIEHGHHGGKENGRLPGTYDNFEDYGISPKSVAPALREVQALGFVNITTRGRASKSDFGRHPNYFGLTYLPGPAPKFADPTNDWKQHQTPADASKVARDARAAKDERAVAKSRARSKKSCAGGEKIPDLDPKNQPKAILVRRLKSAPTALGSKDDPTIYISEEGEADERPRQNN